MILLTVTRVWSTVGASALLLLRVVYELSATDLPHRLFASLRSAIWLFGKLFVLIFVCEALAGAALRRYASRAVLNDLLYGVFYRGGIYILFVYNPFFDALRPKLAVFNLNLLATIPVYVSIPIYFLITDLFGYWIHRLQHTRYLWPFHSVHHSQLNLTFLTFNRFHLVDQFIASVVVFIPLLLLGAPPKLWLWVGSVEWFLQALQHSELNWRYGPFYRVIAGPVFHSVHHSTEPKLLNKNFGMAFSFWDFIFGTAIDAQNRCTDYGVAGLNMPETLSGQFTMPFRMLYQDVITPTNAAANTVVAEPQQLDSAAHAGYRTRN